MRVPISYVFDAGFERCTLVSLFSLLTNSISGQLVFLFSSGSSRVFQEAIAKLCTAFPESRIDLRPMPGRAEAAGSLRDHITGTTLGRLFLPDVIPGRTLYVDGDTIIRRDLSALLEEDLNGHPVGGCRAPRLHASWLVSQEPSRVFWRRPHLRRVDSYRAISGIDPGQYINAGVLLLDTERIRAEGFDEAMRDIERAEQYPQRDQDHLNVVFRDRIHFLSPEWNSIWGNRRTGKKPFRTEERDAYAISRDDPAIVHFTGKEKPWSEGSRGNCGEERRWRQEWHSYERRLAEALGDK